MAQPGTPLSQCYACSVSVTFWPPASLKCDAQAAAACFSRLRRTRALVSSRRRLIAYSFGVSISLPPKSSRQPLAYRLIHRRHGRKLFLVPHPYKTQFRAAILIHPDPRQKHSRPARASRGRTDLPPVRYVASTLVARSHASTPPYPHYTKPSSPTSEICERKWNEKRRKWNGRAGRGQ